MSVRRGRATLQEFELQVLLTVLRLDGETYSVPIVLDLEERTGRTVSQAAVFIALTRLEQKGLLSSRMEQNASGATGRVRRYFRPTKAALRRLKEAREVHTRLWEGLDARLQKIKP